MLLLKTCDARFSKGQAMDSATIRIRARMNESAETYQMIVQQYQIAFVIYKQLQSERSTGTTGIRFPTDWRPWPVPADRQRSPARPGCCPAPATGQGRTDFPLHPCTNSLRNRCKLPTGPMDDPALVGHLETGSPTRRTHPLDKISGVFLAGAGKFVVGSALWRPRSFAAAKEKLQRAICAAESTMGV